MTKPIGRRAAMAAIGGAGLGAVLAACSSSNNSSSETGDTASGGPTTTSSGNTGTTSAIANTNSVEVAALFTDAANCTLSPEQTAGPFYFDPEAMRRDVREDREGQELRLALRVLDPSCAPVTDAIVEIWHCDATGIYSGFDEGEGERFLRGAQVTDANGIVEFVTVYPGWYRGRTVHIHAKAHLDNKSGLTTQLYFDDDFTTDIYQQSPYAEDGSRDTFNADDSLFDDTLVMSLSKSDDYVRGVMTFNIAV